MTAQAVEIIARRTARARSAAALLVLAVAVSALVTVLVSPHLLTVEAHRLLHGFGHLPMPIRTLLGGNKLAHLAS